MRAGSARETSDTNVSAERQAPSLRPRLAPHEFDFLAVLVSMNQSGSVRHCARIVREHHDECGGSD